MWDKNPTYMFSFNVLDETWVKQWFSRKYSDRNVLRLDDFDKNDDVYYIENTRVRVVQCIVIMSLSLINYSFYYKITTIALRTWPSIIINGRKITRIYLSKNNIITPSCHRNHHFIVLR